MTCAGESNFQEPLSLKPVYNGILEYHILYCSIFWYLTIYFKL